MKKEKESDNYRLLTFRLLIRTFIIFFIAIVLTAILYSLFLNGRIADTIVNFTNAFIFHDYARALKFYTQVFRNYSEFYYLGSILLVFIILLRVYMNGFSKYFKEIDKGIDALSNPNSQEVSLSPELFPIEKKINSIKNTLVQQNADIKISEQKKNDLIMYLAHDLKTPLASVIGYLNLLRDEEQISEELKEKYLAISLEKAEHLEDLINEFFEIARFNLSNITLRYSKINLTRLLEQLIYEFQPMLKEKNLSCNLHIAEDQMLNCDADKIQRAFDNLLNNALLYSHEDTAIEITAAEEDSHITVRFVNCGDTISEEKLERIFEQFYRLDSSRGSGRGGAGLGLAIAKQIIELHGGTLTAASGQEKIVFEATLPVS